MTTRRICQTMQETCCFDQNMEWENSYYEVKNNGCKMSDKVIAFNVLDSADLSQMDRKLVFPGMNYSEGKSKKTLLIQMKDDLKKFVGDCYR